MDLPKEIVKCIKETSKVSALKSTKLSLRKTMKKMESFIGLPKVLLTIIREIERRSQSS